MQGVLSIARSYGDDCLYHFVTEVFVITSDRRKKSDYCPVSALADRLTEWTIQTLSRKADNRLADYEITHVIWNQNVHDLLYKAHHLTTLTSQSLYLLWNSQDSVTFLAQEPD